MTHPLVPKIIDLAKPVVANLGLDLVGVVFHTNQYPPVLRVDIRNPYQETGLDDCERISHALEAYLDAAEFIPKAYTLEISSPGISRYLTTDREFICFKGFTIIVSTSPAFKGQQEWIGKLISRDDETIYLNKKGRMVSIPRSTVSMVLLGKGS